MTVRPYRIVAPWLLILCLGGLYGANSALAEIYIFRDSNGVVRFTNAPTHSGYQRYVPERDSPPVPVPPGRYAPIVRSAARRYGVDPNLIWAVMKAESNFNSRAVSKKGAKGLMQLMPETARQHKVSNIYDPAENIHGGVRHLRMLLDSFKGNLRLSLAAYNAGIKAVERYRNVPPYAETRKYVRRVLAYYRHYRRNGAR